MAKTFTLYAVNEVDPPVIIDIPSAESAGIGAEILVKDQSGDAEAHPITVGSDATDIDGQGSYEIASDFGSVLLRSDGESWMVVSAFAGSAGGGTATEVVGAANVNVPITASGTGDVNITAGDDVNISSGSSGGGPQDVNITALDKIVLTATVGRVSTVAPGIALSANVTPSVPNTGETLLEGDNVIIQPNPAATIAEYGGIGAARLAHIADADLTDVHTKLNLLLAYFSARGTMAAS